MVDFRKKILGLAGAAVVFSGMAFAQTTCSTLAPTTGATFIRAEGQTELLTPLTLQCNAAAPTALNLTLYFSVPVTSATVGAATEATASGVAGTISGNTITFTGVPVSGVGGVPILNVRVNASGIPTSANSAPSPLTVTALIGGPGVTANVITSSPVAYAVSGLTTKLVTAIGGSTSYTGSSIAICTGATGSASQYVVAINEGFQNAFKTRAEENGATATTGATSNVASSGTRIKLVFANVPTGVAFYLPTTVPTSAGGTLTLTTSEVGPFIALPAATSPSSVTGSVLNTGYGALAAVTASGTTATAVYEVTSDNPAQFDNVNIPVYAVAAANSVAAQSTATTISVSFAPITAATTVPSFAIGQSTTALNTLTYTVCQTSLLFPFVTNQAGFETGIAISNTSKDPFNNGAKAQSGTCMLNYYGPGGTNPAATQAPNYNDGSLTAAFNGGESYAFTLTNALAQTAGNPAGFQGYVIAQCNFQNAHGFAYITYQFPGTSSSTMGYLALVLQRGSTAAESLGQ